MNFTIRYGSQAEKMLQLFGGVIINMKHNDWLTDRVISLPSSYRITG
jgi:hypothetical protein